VLTLDRIRKKWLYTSKTMIRRRCKAQYLGDYEILARCLCRRHIFLDSRDVGFATHIIMDGFWEFWITRFIAGIVKRGDYTLDIGANFGYYSVLLSDLVGQEGFCHAIEPNAEVVRKLRKTLSVNGFGSRSKVHALALGREESGSVAFYIPAGEPKNARVVGGDYQVPAGVDAHIEIVACSSVDAILANEKKLDFVKIDAEGSEFEILVGMEETLKRFHPKLLIEFNCQKGYDSNLILDKLLDIYYGNLRHVGKDSRLRPVTREQLLAPERLEDWMLYFE